MLCNDCYSDGINSGDKLLCTDKKRCPFLLIEYPRNYECCIFVNLARIGPDFVGEVQAVC